MPPQCLFWGEIGFRKGDILVLRWWWCGDAGKYNKSFNLLFHPFQTSFWTEASAPGSNGTFFLRLRSLKWRRSLPPPDCWLCLHLNGAIPSNDPAKRKGKWKSGSDDPKTGNCRWAARKGFPISIKKKKKKSSKRIEGSSHSSGMSAECIGFPSV